MKLDQAIQLAALRRQPHSKDAQALRTRQSIVERVFELSAAHGHPFEMNPSQWARRWLASRRFRLLEISPHHVAVPNANRVAKERVTEIMASGVYEPLVVDLNKQGIGQTTSGYIPKVIVVDGKHRHQAQVWSGKDRVMAWVGELALPELQARAERNGKFVMDFTMKPRSPGMTTMALSKLSSTASLYAATSMERPVRRADTGDGGSRPTGATGMPGNIRLEGKKLDAQMRSGIARPAPGLGMTRSTPPAAAPSAPTAGGSRRTASMSPLEAFGGSTGGPGGATSGMNPIMRQGLYSETDPSDAKDTPDPSDRQWPPDPSDAGQSPSVQSPGSGGGARLKPDSGASNSEFNQKGSLRAGPVTVKKIGFKKKLEAVAPPGREAQVLKLKEKYGEDSPIPYKIAWSQEKGKE